ncbi:hypothetical protein L210DRAFT_3136356 [Boletus edulis BED1]|uniref:Heterokaryon incompatibility domain-containing protein n=1 Tax=Boletus edulis BED1 TaxID=1328754 RepID=A0AAD4G7Z0_BOLED|nr:hypothetical protein L210DRAFT_3136356 [Boletus edulis BED1]
MKRSKTRASNGSWEDALTDADEVIKLDPSSHRGYARKYMALHGLGDYDAAYDALLHLISVSEDSSDEEMNRLRSNYNRAIAAIDSATDAIFKLCPLVLIDLAMGQLCDREGRRRTFRSETPFKKLVSEAAIAGVDRKHIRQIVVEYFKWVMLSHTWEGEEPTFKDVTEARSVHDLDRSPLDKKLRQFCETARKDDYRWAWSDTCCINKDSSTVLGQSLVSMYSWYEEAAETLVYLADVLSSSQIDALIKSRWMTRAWTLQELLAPKVIRFYDREWKLFLDDSDHPNHKESPVIKQALSQAMGLSPENITSFQPKHLGVREKLRLASTRNAGVEEDTAYSLIGIFSSDIVPQYGLGKVALGQLLENIVARTGDVTVISWTGKSLSYNSALPDSLAVYSKIPFAPPPMDINEFDTCMDKLRTGLAPQAPLDFYYRVTQLPRATFSDRCLRLPCAVFHVTNIGVQKLGGIRGNDYRAMVTLLGKVKFRTTDLMPLNKPQKLVFIHPWLRDLHDLRDGFESDDEREAESNVGSDDKWDSNSAESDGDSEHSTEYNSAPNSPLHAEPAAQMDPYTQALQLIVWLGRPFNALLLEQQSNNQYKRVAAENEIVISGVPYHTDPNDIEVKVLEII